MVTIRGYSRVGDNGYNAPTSIEKVESGPEPATLAEAKAHMRIDFSDEDAYITMLIKACRQSLEMYTGLSLVPTEITAVLHNDISGIDLPYGPYVDGFSATYGDDDTQLSEDEYKLKQTKFPTLYQSISSDITVTYNAGYDEDTLPEDLKLAILNEVAFRYTNRGDEFQSKGLIQSPGARSIASQHKRESWII